MFDLIPAGLSNLRTDTVPVFEELVDSMRAKEAGRAGDLKERAPSEYRSQCEKDGAHKYSLLGRGHGQE